MPRSHFALFQKYLPRDDEAQRAAVLRSEWLAVGMGGEERQRIAEERDRDVRGVALLGVRDHVVRRRQGFTSASTALQWIPSNVTSKRLQRVTQWMSWVCVVRGSALSSSQVRRIGSRPLPRRRSPRSRDRCSGSSPACRTGHFSVRYWPGGRRAGSYPAAMTLRSALTPEHGATLVSHARTAIRVASTPPGLRRRARAGRRVVPPGDGVERRRGARAGRVVRGASAHREGRGSSLR